MEYAELPPAESLRETVRCYWFLQGPAGEGAADPALPDGSPELILTVGDPFIYTPLQGRARRQPRTMLVGQVTAPFHVRPSGRVDLVGVRLEAGGALWLEPSIAGFTNSYRDVSKMQGGALERLRRELMGVGSLEDRARRLDAVLAPLIAKGPRADWRVRHTVAAMRAAHGLVEVEALASAVRSTARTLQRLYAAEVGITPKLLARIVRFQRVFAAWRAEPESLSRVAAACGYFDHAHLVRDFRELAGVAPARFLPNQPEFTRFFTS